MGSNNININGGQFKNSQIAGTITNGPTHLGDIGGRDDETAKALGSFFQGLKEYLPLQKETDTPEVLQGLQETLAVLEEAAKDEKPDPGTTGDDPPAVEPAKPDDAVEAEKGQPSVLASYLERLRPYSGVLCRYAAIFGEASLTSLASNNSVVAGLLAIVKEARK